jgi:hypothetical protein
MRSGVGGRIFEIRPDPTVVGARPLPGAMARIIFARISARGGNARSFDKWCLSQAAAASIGREVDQRYVSKVIQLLPQVAEATPALQARWMAASESFPQPDRIITRRKRGKRIQHNVHRIGVAGEI